MLWVPLVRKTRSGKEFSALSLPTHVSPLQSPQFNFAPLVGLAINAERADQEDREDSDVSDTGEGALNDVDEEWPPADPLDGVDDAWPPLPPPDPWNEVDDDSPTPRKRRRRRYTSPTFPEVKRGHTPAVSTIEQHVQPAVALNTHFDASTLPSALGGYAAKVKDTDKKHGSKVRRSIANFIGLGFHVVEWDGL
ncbi:hypothetical protein DFH09DRAFT_1306979 [Mycena vulgaris]|nr:hypothetical protein DFH09DRAFT_1306979 [Mycena vulgaris]